ncbi:MAG: SRPBCC family protein [Planctomycetota bacterium]|nr:SRPBCC family protein [Planctomycetota bacterium]MDA1141190.1 SRPBCC family protein [Planctomycetota bacterium]
MKQRLKFPALVLFVLFLLFVIIGLFLPGESRVFRTIVIKAEPTRVMPHITSFKNWLAWMPWNEEMDPTIEVKREGPESGVGAIHTWTSKKSGNGKLKIVAVEGNTSMGYHCWFDGSATPSLGSFDLEANEEGTKVAWSFTVPWGHNPFMRYIGLLMSGMLEKDFDRGLAKLKQVVENTPAENAEGQAPTPGDEEPKVDPSDETGKDSSEDEEIEESPANESPPEEAEDDAPVKTETR